MTRLLKNITLSTVVLPDFQGISVDAGEIIDGLQFGEQALRDSTSVAMSLLDGTLSVSDGFTTFLGNDALNLVKGIASQTTRDGKPIYTMSDRPKNTFRYLTSRSDDLVNNKVGEGSSLLFDVAPGVIQPIDMVFLEDIYIKDGYAQYGGSTSNNSWLSVVIVAPAGLPFPAPAGNGNYDNIGGTWTPNTSGTGAFFIVATETVINRFANHLPLSTFAHEANIEGAEPSLIPAGYILRILVDNGSDSTTNLEAAVYVGCYRRTTIN